MPFKHGKSTNVYLGSRDLSPYLNAADFSTDVDTADTSVFGANWKTFIAGQASAKQDFQGLYDPAITDFQSLIAVDPGAVLTYAPAGALAIGDRARLMSIGLTAYAESSPIGDAVSTKWAVMASGPVGFADVLHILTADSGTTTGASKDDSAATSTGWIAHLHVTAVTGSPTSWTVKLQDSADNSSWADVTGASFTPTAAATAQRLVSATTTTTLRRYVRYVATVVGGSTPTITFVLAYSRNS